MGRCGTQCIRDPCPHTRQQQHGGATSRHARAHVRDSCSSGRSRWPISNEAIGNLGARCPIGRLTGLYSSPYSNFRRAIDSSARRRSLSRIASNSAMYLAANARTRSRGSSNQSKFLSAPPPRMVGLRDFDNGLLPCVDINHRPLRGAVALQLQGAASPETAPRAAWSIQDIEVKGPWRWVEAAEHYRVRGMRRSQPVTRSSVRRS